MRRPAAHNPTRRVFLTYAGVSLLPIAALGLTLVTLLHREATQRGIGQGASEAQLVASTTIAPLLDGHPLIGGLTPGEAGVLRRRADGLVHSGQVLRLRVRDSHGRVVFAQDGSGLGTVDGEAAEAADGHTIADLTWLNSDRGDHGVRGPRVVEAYTVLRAAQDGAPIGVLEVYLPFAPIAADIAHGQGLLTASLGVGLAVLWVALLGVSVSVGRRLRGQSAANAYQARHDALTDLPNRLSFATQAADAVAHATPEHPVGIAVIDIDRFKEVNDTLGHGNGDRLLVALADRLGSHLREGDVLARLGGDEFGIILPGVRNAGECTDVLNRLRAVLAEPLLLDGLPLAVEASVGFALAPGDGQDVDTLLSRADLAMYVGKRQHHGVVHYQPAHDQYDAGTLSLVAQLGSAIRDGELVLHYQPKADLRLGRFTAVEALVRWYHPVRGLLSPDAFLPAAEQTELVESLTRWVLRTATADLARMDPTGELAVAVNVSARSLIRHDFADDVLAVLAETRTHPARVILEVTETALLADPARAAATLTRLHDVGVRISIDDFGAGHTSLSYLATLPVSELKIDKSFVLGMTDARTRAIVRSVIDLGHNLGFTVTAEGVETAEALAQLSAARCDLVQGYLLARPMPWSQVHDLLAASPVVSVP